MLDFPPWKKTLIGVVCLLGVLYAAPNLFPSGTFASLPEWAPGKEINLGLDLQGGSHLLLEVDIETVERQQLQSLLDSIRVTLREDRIRLARRLQVEGQNVVFMLQNPADREAVRSSLIGDNLGIEVETTDAGEFRIGLSESEWLERQDSVIEQTLEILRIRIDELGTTEPTIQRQGENRILVQVPGIDDPEQLKTVIGTTAQLTFHLVDDSVSAAQAEAGRIPPGSMLLPSDEVDSAGQPLNYLVRRSVVVSGENLTDAQPSFQDNQPVVSFTFDPIGGRKFGDATSENVGRLLAIVLDGTVISAPRIQTAILGGSGVITGRFTVQAVNDLSLLLRAGALPAPLFFLEERTVGPGLGQDSIDAGKIASMIGLVAVVVFMVLCYGLFGLMANIALFFNMALIFAVLSGLQATLTLPGIAGIVLTIGMAVDANVLIFERIREEIANGRTPISAVDSGYRRALTTIVDANVTTLIAAVVLFVFGSGPIKGFAITLSIGIATSMFTAIMVTRFVVVSWLRRKRPAALPI